MGRLHLIVWMAKCQYRKFWTVKTVLFLAFSVIFLGESVIGKMIAVSLQTGLTVNYLEPVMLILSSSFYAMIIPISFLVLLADFPDNHTGGIFMMVRIRRKIWLCAQILYALLVGLTYFGILLAGSIFWIGSAGGFSNRWSPYMTELYVRFPDIYTTNQDYFISADTVTQGNPVGVLLTGIFLMLFFLVTLAQILCIFKLTGHKRVGLICGMALTVLGAVAAVYLDKLKWFFPMAHAIFGMHFRDFFSEPECRILYSVLYFAALNMVLWIFNRFFVKRFQIGDERV